MNNNNNATAAHVPTGRLDEAVHISNEEFLAALYLALPGEADGAVCSFPGDPEHQTQWRALPAKGHGHLCEGFHNNYFNCGSFRSPEVGHFRVHKPAFAACHALVLDDIGGKIPLENVAHFTFSWLLETSPNNYQAGILLREPVTSIDEATRVHRALIARGLCDPGASGPATRWARLPVGANGKPKHRVGGVPFACRLTIWNPDARYTLDEIVSGFSLSLEPAESKRHETCDDEGRKLPGRDIGELRALVSVLDPDCGYADWLRVLLALHYETGGDEAGLELADSWSAGGKKYGGSQEIETKWKSFTSSENPVTIATLIKMVEDAGRDWTKVIADAGPQFELCETIIVESPQSTKLAKDHALAKYSIRERLAELKRAMVEQRPLLGDIVLVGQATVIYAMANTGKTLITMALLLQAIEQKRIDPRNVFYINMDDNSSGLVQKGQLAQDYGFEMLADGYENFQANAFREAMLSMIDNDAANGVVIILDTLKKFVNTMDKSKSSDFAKVVRRFVMKGGTVIALAHTNKKLDADGNPVYSGTTDIVDDFDCAYTMKAVLATPGDTERTVHFTNIKRRGDVPLSAAYRYAWGQGVTYLDLLSSVTPVTPEDLMPMLQAAAIRSDAEVIASIEDCIRRGIDTKMLLIKDVADKTGLSQRAVATMLEKYRGPDPAQHRWDISRVERGALRHRLHEQRPALPG